MSEEVWVPITKPINLSGIYEVSNLGRLKRCAWVTKTFGYSKPERIIKGYLNDKGYVKVTLGLGGAGKKYALARLVALHFVDNPNNLPEVNHMDFNKLNNRADNLEWTDGQGNMDHYYASDTVKRRKPTLKISKEDVIYIRKMFLHEGIDTLAEKFDTAPQYIYGIATGRARKDVDFEPLHKSVDRKIIIDINYGVFYESVKELSALIGKSPKEIHRRLNGERPNNTPYRYC